MRDSLDIAVQDDDVLDEIDLCTNLLIAASESDGRLPPDVIDQLLHLTRPSP